MKPTPFTDENYAIPFEDVKEMVDYLPYGHKYRVALMLLTLTGCRICELDNMGINSIGCGFLYWKTGKNQKGFRKEDLPDWFMSELQYHIDNNHCSNNRLFDFKGNSFRRIFNKEIRPKLNSNWQIKYIKANKKYAVEEYAYQLKGLRHNFASLDFYNNFCKWGGTVALEFTCKRMKHSSYKITCGHYIGGFDKLKIDQYKGCTMSEILHNKISQRRIGEFG